MRRMIAIGIMVLVVLNLTTNGYCQDAFRKLGRGVVNIATSPIEILKSIGSTYKDKGLLDAVGLGVPKGVVMMAVRAGLGVYEIFTFPVPIPEGYEPALLPEFVWQP